MRLSQARSLVGQSRAWQSHKDGWSLWLRPLEEAQSSSALPASKQHQNSSALAGGGSERGTEAVTQGFVIRQVSSLGTRVLPADQPGLVAPPRLTPCPALVPGPCPRKGYQRWTDQDLAAFPAPGTIQERGSGHKIQGIQGAGGKRWEGEPNCIHQKEPGAPFSLFNVQ